MLAPKALPSSMSLRTARPLRALSATAFLDGVLGDEPVHYDVAGLPDAIGPVDGLRSVAGYPDRPKRALQSPQPRRRGLSTGLRSVTSWWPSRCCHRTAMSRGRRAPNPSIRPSSSSRPVLRLAPNPRLTPTSTSARMATAPLRPAAPAAKCRSGRALSWAYPRISAGQTGRTRRDAKIAGSGGRTRHYFL